MAETIRFWPVIIGEPPDEGVVYYVADGSIFFQDAENPWLLDGTLESVTPQDVPEFYRSWPAEIRILPVRVASGETRLDADEALIREIERLAKTGVPKEALAGAAT